MSKSTTFQPMSQIGVCRLTMTRKVSHRSRFPIVSLRHDRHHLRRLRQGGHPRRTDHSGGRFSQGAEARLQAAHRLRSARREDLERADHEALCEGRPAGPPSAGGGELPAAPDRRLFLRSADARDRKSTRLNSSHVAISYAVFCLKKKKKKQY